MTSGTKYGADHHLFHDSKRKAKKMINCFSNYDMDTVDKALTNGVWLFGAGVNGIWCKEHLESNSYIVNGFIDNNPSKIGTLVSGKKCISWEQFQSSHQGELVFVTAKHYAKEILETIKYNYAVSFDEWYLSAHEKEYSDLIFNDEKSYKVLKKIKSVMLSNDESELYEICDLDQYFDIAPFFNCGGEHYVDMGGYVGDTVEKFISSQNGEFNNQWC